VAIEIVVGILEQSLVSLKLPLHLCQLRLKRARIDLGQEVALMDHLSFAIVDTHELSIHAALGGNGVERCHGTQSIHVNSNVAFLGRGGGDCQGARGRSWFVRLGLARFEALKEQECAAEQECEAKQTDEATDSSVGMWPTPGRSWLVRSRLVQSWLGSVFGFVCFVCFFHVFHWS